MKKAVLCVAMLLIFTSLLSLTSFGNEESSPSGLLDLPDYLWEITDDMTDDEVILLQQRNEKIVNSFLYLLDGDSYKAWQKAAHYDFSKNTSRETALACYDAMFTMLVQTDKIADRVWFLWDGQEMPNANEKTYSEAALDAGKADGYGFQPFVITYLQDDPSTAVGNVLIVPGGDRLASVESDPLTETFRSYGYNVFLVQRRAIPYTQQDYSMDAQRALKLVRYHGVLEHWGGMDLVGMIGLSMGGLTTLGVVNDLYGERTPADTYCPSYLPDQIDEINGDLDVALIIYGASDDPVNLDNPNLPAFYICVGTADATGAWERSVKMYEQLDGILPVMYREFEGAGHGLDAKSNQIWRPEADVFMQENRGRSMQESSGY